MALRRNEEASWRAGALLADLELPAGGWESLQLSGLALDSRRARAGHLFLACRGGHGHGLDHLQEAVARGAVLALAEPAERWGEGRIQALSRRHGISVLPCEGLRRKASGIAARFYGGAAGKMRMIGVTGTNGKSSVTLFLAQALPERWRCAVTGTLGNGFPGALEPSSHTTPDAVEAQRVLASLHDAGARAVAMEVSSHALDQHRLAAVPFHTVLFTNLSRDHLDYHGSMQAYAAAKEKLFQQESLELAVLNSDDELGGRLVRRLRGRVRTVACHRGGRTLGADEFLRLESLEQGDAGLRLKVASSWGGGVVESPLVGEFNATNLLLVLGVMLSWGVPMEEAAAALARLQPVPGRMQCFGGGAQPLVAVDYAHTPDALQRALTSLRGHTQGRLWCVFGCGGDRDRGKRPQMGRIAEALADRVILTDDNPRHEPSASIIADILEGMESPGEAHVIPDRAWAIATALAEAQPGDSVLVAGKGHETHQQIGDLKQPFSDVEQVRRWLEETL